jgi:hypothetical protein
MMEEAKQQFTNNFFMEVFMIGSWHIWKQRNGFIFNRGRPSFQNWKHGFVEEAFLQAHRMNSAKNASFINFLFMFS